MRGKVVAHTRGESNFSGAVEKRRRVSLWERKKNKKKQWKQSVAMNRPAARPKVGYQISGKVSDATLSFSGVVAQFSPVARDSDFCFEGIKARKMKTTDLEMT